VLARCKAKTKAGGACAAPAVKRQSFCFLHSDPGRAAELGCNGGRSNRHIRENEEKEVLRHTTTSAVKKLLAHAMAEIRPGKIA
jgi:hypothetical protein